MNKRRYFAWLGIGLALILAFGGGVYLGVILGVDQFLKLESSAKGAILTDELLMLRAGHVEKIIERKELQLDGSVVDALAFQESGMPWLFWPYMHSMDHTSALRRVEIGRASCRERV